MKKIFSLVFSAFALSVSAQYTIYPVPQQMTPASGKVAFTPTVSVVCDAAIDTPTRDRIQQILSEHGLTANFTTQPAAGTAVVRLKVDEAVGVAGKYDAHRLVLSARSGASSTAGGNAPAELTVTGQDTNATFMGLASLEQMLDAVGDDRLQAVDVAMPCVSINDYADQLQRGLVEGYYGYPYSVEVKQDLMRFMMRMKMNSYMYGAKSDPFHLSRWKEAYPTTITEEQQTNGWLTQKMVQDICATSAATKVNFIWAIHPGDEFLGSATVIDDIMAKYQKMYDLGVRQFGLFVDDVSIPKEQADLTKNATRVTQLQNAIDERWNTAGADLAAQVKPLNFVPQIYCTNFASSDTQYRNFFTALKQTPSKVIVYTTGGGVWSVPNTGDFNAPKAYLGRDVAWWWNYPCNDNADSQIYPMDMYQNFRDMPAVASTTLPANLNAGVGIVANPMQQGEVAKIPLFSVADYAWNSHGFSNADSWSAAFPLIFRHSDVAMSESRVKADALKALAPYLTYNDPAGDFPAATEEQTLLNADRVLASIATVKALATSDVRSDQLMWRDLSPWVLKLEQMLRSTQYLIAAKNGDAARDVRWNTYITGSTLAGELESKEEFISYTLEGMRSTTGTPHIAKPSQRTFAPYIQTLRKNAVRDLIPAASKSAVPYASEGIVPFVSTEGGNVYARLASTSLAPGQYVGIALANPHRISQMLVAGSLTTNFAVSISADGREWTRLSTTGSDTRSVSSYVKYVKIANEGSTSKNISLSNTNLRLTLFTAPTVESITAPVEKDYNERANISDGNVETFWCPYQNQANGDVIRLNLSKAAPIRTVRFVVHNTNNDVMKRGRIEASLQPTSGFTALPLAGSSKTSFALADMTPLHEDGTPYRQDEDASGAHIYEVVCEAPADFSAQYVRFYNESASTGNWIRVAEFTVNYDLVACPAPEAPAVCDGQAHTASLVKAGNTLAFDPQTAYAIESAEAFTDQGIIALNVGEDGRINFSPDRDMYVYEIVVRTDEQIVSEFSASTSNARYYGIKFNTGNYYIGEGGNDGLLLTTSTASTSWALIGNEDAFRLYSNGGKYVGVKTARDTNGSNSQLCYVTSNAAEATTFVMVGNDGTTFEIARSTDLGSTFNPLYGNAVGKNIGFWNVGAANNRLVLVDVDQPEVIDPDAQAVFPINVPYYQTYNNSYNRHLNNITLTSASTGAQQIDCNASRVYNDLTRQTIVAARGEDLTVRFGYQGDWMNGYVYLDRNRDGNLDTRLNSNGTPAEGSEILAYSFYSGNDNDDTSGQNSKGQSLSTTARNVLNPPTFRLPDDLPAGTYTMRFKVDWNSVNPAGDVNEEDGTLLSNGGAIVDVTLRVVRAQSAQRPALKFDTNCGFFVANASERGIPERAPLNDLALRLVRPATAYAFPAEIVVTAKAADGTVVNTTACSIDSEGCTVIPAAAFEPSDDMGFDDSVAASVTVTARFVAPDAFGRNDYQMALCENFNGPDHSQPNSAIWERAAHNNNSAWNRFVSDSEKVVYVENGDLVTRCIPCADEDRESNKDALTGNYRDWMSGAVDTRGLLPFRFGRIDVRALTNPFAGSFPAIWLMPMDTRDGWPNCGEIDIWEMVNTNEKAHGTVHAKNESQNTANTPCVYDGLYHVYSLEWTPERLEWSIDGKVPYSTYAKSSISQADLNAGFWPFDKNFYLILNQSVGNGSWATAPVAGHEYETRFDFVHIYQTYNQNNNLDLDINPAGPRVYNIRLKNTNLYLSTAECKDGSYRTYTLSDQPEGFTIAASGTAGRYNIVSTNGKRLGYGAANQWDCSDTQNDWKVEGFESITDSAPLTTKILKDASVGLGVDSSAAGAGVFTNKANVQWEIIDVTPVATPATVGTLSRFVDALPTGRRAMSDVLRVRQRILDGIYK